MQDELIDVLDENGVFTGKVAMRREAHAQGLWHRAIVVAILSDNNQILLQQRGLNKEKNPGKWDISVAGHVSAGQIPTDAAIREVAEEVGLDIDENASIADFKYIFSYRAIDEYANGINERQFFDFFILRWPNLRLEDIRRQESEVQAVKLCTMSELRQMIASGELVQRDAVYAALERYIFNI